MFRIVAIKFREAGKQYDFNAQQWELRRDDLVVVETDRGRALGTVVFPPREVPGEEIKGELKNVLRPASDEDRAMAEANAAREQSAFEFCRRRIDERRMEMKLVRAEYLFDGSKIVFYFTADGRIDFRELVKDLAHHFHTRIEMRQIGVRDEAKLTGGIGICGRELCCCTFLTEFAPVSVKMAKEQGLALNPSKISGQCGRLLCCLAYEFETYSELRKGLPKCGRKVSLDGDEVEVADINVLTQTVTVKLPDGNRAQLDAEALRRGERRPKPPAGPQEGPDAGGGERREGEGQQRSGRDRPPRRGSGPQRKGGGGGKGGAAPSDRAETPTTSDRPGQEPSPPKAGEEPPKKKSRRRSRSRRKPRRKDE